LRSAGPPVVVSDLVKRYPKSPTNAVDGISFTVEAGEVFGLLGPNGAGKTTTVGVLTTRVRPTGGHASVGGVDVVADPVRARGQVAVVPQRNNLDRSLSIRNNLVFHAAYHGVPARERAARADELLAEFGLLERAATKPEFFSGGQVQRVMIARALMHAPTVLFLDEPTTGLDPAARLFVWDRLRQLEERGVTLVLTTHDMDEAAALATRVGIMDRGKLLALDTPAALVRSLPGQSTLELATQSREGDDEAVISALGALPRVERVEQVRAPAGGGPSGPPGFPGDGRQAGGGGSPGPPADGTPPGAGDAGGGELRLRLYVSGEAPLLVAPAVSALSGLGRSLTDLRLGTPSLEDVFIHLTGRSLR
jgi:ABC-2 type transport system ATP-binding protein